MAKFNNYFENFSATKIVSLHPSVFFAVPVHAVGGVIFPLFPVSAAKWQQKNFRRSGNGYRIGIVISKEICYTCVSKPTNKPGPMKKLV